MISLVLIGLSGSRYSFNRQPFQYAPPAAPGLYALCRFAGLVPIPLYIGETVDLADRLGSHPMWPLAIQHGASDRLIMEFHGTEAERQSIERDLIGYYRPILNTQHRNVLADLLAGR